MKISAVAALVTGLLLHVIIPGLLGVVLAVVVSGLTLLDPLYAGERTNSTWLTLGTILIIQGLQTFITATGVGVLLGYLALRLQSFWLYPAAALISVVLHYLLFFVFAVALSFISSKENSGLVWGLTLGITTFVAPIIGLVSVFAIRQWGM